MNKTLLIMLFLFVPLLLVAGTPIDFAFTCTAEEMQSAIDNGLDPNISLRYSTAARGRNGRLFSFDKIPISVYATANPDKKVLNVLIENGAHVNDRTLVLNMALKLDYATLDSVQTLLPYYEDKRQLLSDAASFSSNTAIVKLIASNVPSINNRKGGGSFYLAEAVKNGMLDNAKILINLGADIHETLYSDNGYTRNLLMLAAESGSVEMCEYILSLGYDVKESIKGRTALFYASNAKVAEFLIESGAGEELIKFSKYLITEALRSFKFDLAAVFLNQITDDGNIPEYVFTFFDQGYRINYIYIPRFASYLTKENKDALLKHVAYILATEIDKNNLHTEETISLLIAMNYDFNTEIDEEGNTLLHLALNKDDMSYHIHYLLDAGADANKLNDNQESPLSIVLKRMCIDLETKDLPILAMLHHHGGDFENVVDRISKEIPKASSIDFDILRFYLSFLGV